MKTIAIFSLFVPALVLAQVSPGAVTPATAGPTRTTSFVADASVKNVFAGKSEERPASGSLGMTNTATHDKFALLITVANSLDTIAGSQPRTFGRALLTGGSSGDVSGPSLSVDYQRYYEYNATTLQQIAGRVYFSLASATWTADDDQGTASEDLSMLTYGGRIVWTVIRNVDPKGNDFAVTIEPGWTFRSLAGDIADNEAFRVRTLGVKRTTFHGPEVTFSIQLRQLTAIANLPLLDVFGNKEKVKGLTGLQPVLEFRVHAPFLTL
jgi:hypothetical protein